MTPSPLGSSDSVNVRFANHRGFQKEAILGEWLKRVRGDSAINLKETLNTVVLQDRLALGQIKC